jgi:uncharacterized membrane protein
VDHAQDARATVKEMSAAVVERDRLETSAARVNRGAIAAWALVSGLGLTLVGLIAAAPLALSQGHQQFAATLYKAFSFVCHQIPHRSFHLAEHQFAVCSRCTGLYAGFAVAALSYPLVRSLKSTDTPPRLWLILAAVPLAIDFALGYFSIWENNHLSRFTTGALLGTVAVFYIIPGLIELSSRIGRGLARKKSQG